MRAAFIHDHIFPIYNGKYYESSGFDKVFTNRYLNIFGDVRIIARQTLVTNKPSEKFKPLEEEGLEFTTFSSSKEIMKGDGKMAFREAICGCDCAVIRVPSVLGILAADICKKERIPYVVEVVGCPWDAVATRGVKWIAPAMCFTLLTKRVVRQSKYAIYVTEKFLEKRYPSKAKQIPCSNVTLENYGSVDLDTRKESIRGFNKSKFVIGTCASVDTIYKGQDDVIRAIAELKKRGIIVTYQIAGGGDGGRLEKLVAQLHLDNQVTFLGELKHDDVFPWLDKLDIYVHPSKQEGLCRAVIEAMSRACPIIAADAGGIHEQIQEECIFPKGDISAIVGLLSNIDLNILMKNALENYQNAAKYQSELLYKRRNNFFAEFIEENKTL